MGAIPADEIVVRWAMHKVGLEGDPQPGMRVDFTTEEGGYCETCYYVTPILALHLPDGNYRIVEYLDYYDDRYSLTYYYGEIAEFAKSLEA